MSDFGRSVVWDSAHFTIAPHCAMLRFGDANALFCERTQKLHQLNDTALVLWRALEQGGDAHAAARALSAQEIAAAQAHAFAEQAIREWLSKGYIFPSSALSAPADDTETVSCRFSTGSVAIRLHGRLERGRIRTELEGFAAESDRQLAVFDIVGFADAVLFFRDGAPVGMRPLQEASPQLKAMLAETFAGAIPGGFLAHGAMLTRGDVRLLLSAPSGAGKTTLALMLTQAGFLYGGDDLVYITPQGLAEGLCFPAALKPSGWTLLGDRMPEILDLPVHTRGDAVRVRYVLPQQRDTQGPKPITSIVRLKRNSGMAPGLVAISSLDAFCALLESGWSNAHRSERTMIVQLAAALASGRHYDLHYDDLDQGVAALSACFA
jgi:hypothetical protein